jgi:glycolate oxidase FAD binding subunit
LTVVKRASLAPELLAAAGKDNVSPGDPSFAVDGVDPAAVVSPRSYDNVCHLLTYASEHRLAIIPLGARQHAGLGNLPARYDIALDTRRLNAVVEFEPADLTITCRAGMTLGDLRRTTAASGLTVPFEPSIPDDATIGGVLAANVSGPSRISLGQPRDFTIGMRVVTADGRLTRAGGRVVKNVAGYDLCKLYIGSLGTLGVIVEATFKTVPLPHKELALAFDFASPDAACKLVSHAGRAGLNVHAASVRRDATGWHLGVDLWGAPAAVARSEFDIAASASGLGGTQTPVRDSSGVESPVVARIDATPRRLPALLSEVAGSPGAPIIAQPWDGVCRIGLPATAEAIEGARAIAGRLAAPCVIERCPAELKREIEVFGPVPASFPLMQAIKWEFDPSGVLSPGRFVGRL